MYEYFPWNEMKHIVIIKSTFNISYLIVLIKMSKRFYQLKWFKGIAGGLINSVSVWWKSKKLIQKNWYNKIRHTDILYLSFCLCKFILTSFFKLMLKKRFLILSSNRLFTFDHSYSFTIYKKPPEIDNPMDTLVQHILVYSSTIIIRLSYN